MNQTTKPQNLSLINIVETITHHSKHKTNTILPITAKVYEVGRFIFFYAEPSSPLHMETSYPFLTYAKVYAKRMKESKIGQQIQAKLRNS